MFVPPTLSDFDIVQSVVPLYQNVAWISTKTQNFE